MSVIDSLITNRTLQDSTRAVDLHSKVTSVIATVEELKEWLGNPKGTYNHTDLNRVSEAMHYLMSRFNLYGYAVSVHSRTNWTMTDVPTKSDMNTYLLDLKSLRDTFGVLQGTPEVPADMELFTWQEANDIEQILVNINLAIERIFRSFKRSGSFTFWSGYQPLPSAESDLGRTIDDIDALNLTVDDLDAHGTSFYILSYGVIK